MGDHENGSAAPHLAFQPFRDQAHNSARQDRWLTHQESVSCDRKRRRRRWQAVAFVRRTGWTGAHPCTRKGQILSADVLHGLCFLPSIRYSAAVPPPHSPQKTALTCHCRSIRYSCAGLPLLLFSILNNAIYLHFRVCLLNQQCIVIFCFVRPRFRPLELCLIEMLCHHFQRLTVFLVHGKKEERQHHRHHAKSGKAQISPSESGDFKHRKSPESSVLTRFS